MVIPKRSGSEKRKLGETITVRVSKADKDEFKRRAERAGLSASGLFKQACLDKPEPRKIRFAPYDRRLAGQCLGQLGKLGGNVNQIAFALNRLLNRSEPIKDRDLKDKIEMAIECYETLKIDHIELRTTWMDCFNKKS